MEFLGWGFVLQHQQPKGWSGLGRVIEAMCDSDFLVHGAAHDPPCDGLEVFGSSFEQAVELAVAGAPSA